MHSGFLRGVYRFPRWWIRLASGVARYIGRGLNRWSNVHIADVVAVYTLAVVKARAGSFMYVESGEEALGEVVRAIATRLNCESARRNDPAEINGANALTSRSASGSHADLQPCCNAVWGEFILKGILWNSLEAPSGRVATRDTSTRSSA